MTTNKPEVVAWIWDYRGRHVATTDYSQALELAEPPYPTEVEPLIRLADYQRLQALHEEELFQVRQDRDAHFGELIRALEQVDALQAECEKLKEQLDAMTEYKVAAHQLIGIPASVRISEPIEGFAKRPQDFMPAVRDMAVRIELLERQAAEREWQLAESRANDQQAMAYLTQIRELVGGDDFPDMIERVRELQAECDQLRKDAERYRSLLEAVLREIPHREGRRGNAPGHGHSVPGVWDEDNGALAGKECAWCKVWREALAAMQGDQS